MSKAATRRLTIARSLLVAGVVVFLGFPFGDDWFGLSLNQRMLAGVVSSAMWGAASFIATSSHRREHQGGERQ